MSAMLKPFAPWSLSEAVVSDFVRKGVHLFDEPVDAEDCAGLLAEIRGTRRFDASLFLSEAEFDADPQYTGVNPRPGRNLLERFEDQLGFVERAPHIVEARDGAARPRLRDPQQEGGLRRAGQVGAGLAEAAHPRQSGEQPRRLCAAAVPRRDLFLRHRFPPGPDRLQGPRSRLPDPLHLPASGHDGRRAAAICWRAAIGWAARCSRTT